MSRVSFDDQYVRNKASAQGPVITWLLKRGVVKNAQQANRVLLWVSVIALTAATLLFLNADVTADVPVPPASEI